MARKKKESSINPDAWMATYSDMVTLLMCFFVMLYAASTPDQTKWQYIFQSFTNSGKYVNPFVMDKDPNLSNNPNDVGNSMEPPGSTGDPNNNITNSEYDLPTDFNNFSSWAAGIAEKSEYSEDISVLVNSSGSITIRFTDAVFFEPNSAVLTAAGRTAINKFVPGLKAISKYIGGITVAGHTAQGIGEVNDWDLSGSRASSVLKHMDYQTIIDSALYKYEAYAQYKPIADNDTEEGRRQNRRVEVTIVRNNDNTLSNAVVNDILKYDYAIGLGGPVQGGTSTEDHVQQIIGNLSNKYGTTITPEGGALGNESGPGITSPIVGIPDSAIHEVDEDGNIITDE